MSKDIEIKLTEDEAWVLFELTRRFSDTDKLDIIDQSEERALWNLCCTFEKVLHQDSDLEYQDFIAQRRSRLKDKE
jgi:hypothetical protein